MAQVHGQQILGRRETQEDAFDIILQSETDPRSDVLMLLADGMGGHAGGEVASGLALRAFAHHFTQVARAPRPADRLQEALEAANEAIRGALARDASLRGMGCTLIAAIKLPDRLVWVSVGDSAIYLLRRGTIRRINADHSIFGELMALVEAGRMTRAEAASHPRRNVLRSALTGGPLTLVDLNSATLEPGDVVLIASDGLDALSEAEVVEIVGERMRAGPRAATEALLAAVERKANPSQDNTSVILYRHAGQGANATLTPPRRLAVAAGAGAVLALAGLAVYAGMGGFSDPPAPQTSEPPPGAAEMRAIPAPAEEAPAAKPEDADPQPSEGGHAEPEAQPRKAAAPEASPAPARRPAAREGHPSRDNAPARADET
ncbi:protein phosphatase 2C domain-containing protein [Cereibacter sphaeroides WS8N]|uniref:PP2C family protein-serine/threonine phosphatase n=1 Tax=Cereibacter sphaeroides TaxID=1063 RepID=UPI00020B0191|nr:protein phosphatase 2C domain-containing protein [Cereibacter sphaeroides]EGJ19861.1 protein phosphatase 2C domain-containing protein [Cereibacter sphaeroides WS8N]